MRDLEELGEELLDVLPAFGLLAGQDGGLERGELVGVEVEELCIAAACRYCEVGDGADAAAGVGSATASATSATCSSQVPNGSSTRS